MAMNNDEAFVREVDEELRQDQLKSLWRRFGPGLIGLAFVIVIAVGGWRAFEYWTESRANASGDRFLAAMALAGEGKTDEALAALKTLEADGYGAYPVLARLRAATVLQATDPKAAIAAFDAVAADGSVAAPLRDIARLRAAYLLVDAGTREEVAARAEALSADGNALRHSAREALGLAAWKAGMAKDAALLFQSLADDTDTPAGIAERAGIMLDVMAGAGKP